MDFVCLMSVLLWPLRCCACLLKTVGSGAVISFPFFKTRNLHVFPPQYWRRRLSRKAQLLSVEQSFCEVEVNQCQYVSRLLRLSQHSTMHLPNARNQWQNLCLVSTFQTSDVFFSWVANLPYSLFLFCECMCFIYNVHIF